MAINLSKEPKIALWIMTGLSNPFFMGCILLYSEINKVFTLLLRHVLISSSMLPFSIDFL